MGRCIMCTRIRLLLPVHPFISSFFFLSNFQTLKFFVTLFSGTVRPRRLKLGTHMDSRQMYRLYWNQAAAAYLSLYFSFFYLSNFQTLKIFITLFSGTVKPRRLKLGIHVDNGQMFRVYQNQAASAYSSLYWTVKPRRLKLDIHVDSGQMYRVYQNQAASAYSSLYFFIFLSLQFSNIEIFRHTFLRNCEA